MNNIFKDRVKFMVKGKVVPEHHAMEVFWGSGVKVPCILDLSSRWR